MRKLFGCALLLCCIYADAQKAANPKPYAALITAADLKKHLYIIAGPEMEGRLTASPGQRRAAAYIENESIEWGKLIVSFEPKNPIGARPDDATGPADRT